MNYGLARNLSCHFLKVWACDAYVKRFQPDKLEPKSEKCVFIGYPKETVGYTFYHRSEGKIFIAKNGSFLEKEFLSKEVSRRKVELDECRCQNWRISGRGSRTVRLGRMVTGGKGHKVLPRFGPS